MIGAAPRGARLMVEDAFLTQVLERRVGRLDTDLIDLTSENFLQEVRSFDFAWSKVSTDEPLVVTRLLRMGFELVATELQFELPLNRWKTPGAASSSSVRMATQDDRVDVIRIAKESFRDDRFHKDLKIGANAADAVKEKWASNFFTGSRGNRMFIAIERGGTIEGFIQLVDSDTTTVIDLVAVATQAQRRGLGEGLVAAAIESAPPSIDRFIVGTQITNSASVRLYSRLGFTIVASSHVLHYHRDHVVAPR